MLEELQFFNHHHKLHVDCELHKVAIYVFGLSWMLSADLACKIACSPDQMFLVEGVFLPCSWILHGGDGMFMLNSQFDIHCAGSKHSNVPLCAVGHCLHFCQDWH